MDEFVAIVTNFPTAVFSAALIVVCVFLLLTILGLADLELFELEMGISPDSEPSGFGGLAGLLMRYGLAGIPVTVIISLLVLLSWLLCYFASAYLLPLLPGEFLKAIGGVALIAGCLFFAFPITAAALRPTRQMFVGATAITNKELVGEVCEVRSGEVTEEFGQGDLDDGGAGFLIDIRANTPNNIQRGDRVAITKYHPESNTYSVLPEDEFMSL